MNKDATKAKKEPLFHVVKNTEVNPKMAWLARIISILLSLIVCGIVTMALTNNNPIRVYGTMIKGAFGSPTRIWNLVFGIAILLCVSLAVTPAFKMKFWNIGAEGQTLMGGLATTACMVLLGGKIPNPLLIVIMVAAAMLGGALWAFIPAFFKAQFGTNETLFTLMMNYVATQLVAYFTVLWESPKGSGNIGIINQKTHAGWLPTLYNDHLLSIIVVALLTVFMFVYLKYSKHGYELTVVGDSPNTARYIGINTKKVIMRTMILSGAICGIAGLLLVGGTDHTITTTTVDGRGFTAIMVSWLAKFNPLTMILTSFLIVFLQKGAGEIATVFRLNKSFSDILTGIIIFFIIGVEFFINYKVIFREKGAKKKAVVPPDSPKEETTQTEIKKEEN